MTWQSFEALLEEALVGNVSTSSKPLFALHGFAPDPGSHLMLSAQQKEAHSHGAAEQRSSGACRWDFTKARLGICNETCPRLDNTEQLAMAVHLLDQTSAGAVEATDSDLRPSHEV